MTRRGFLSFVAAPLIFDEKKVDLKMFECLPKDHPFVCAWRAMIKSVWEGDNVLKEIHGSLAFSDKVKDVQRPKKWLRLFQHFEDQLSAARKCAGLDNF